MIVITSKERDEGGGIVGTHQGTWEGTNLVWRQADEDGCDCHRRDEGGASVWREGSSPPIVTAGERPVKKLTEGTTLAGQLIGNSY